MSMAEPRTRWSPLNRLFQVPPAHHGGRGRPWLVVRFVEHPAQRRPYAKRLEEIAGDHLRRDRIVTTARLRRERRKAEQIREDVVPVAILLVIGEAEHVQRRVTRILICELHKAGRVAHGHVAKQQRIHEAEDGGVGADGEGQRQERHGRDHWRAPEHSRAEARVLKQILEPRQPPLIAPLVHHWRDAARLQARLAQRFLRGQAAALQIGREHVEVKPQLLLHDGVLGRLAERAPQPPQPLADDGHHSDSLSSACMIVTVRFYSCFSTASCLRPATVMA